MVSTVNLYLPEKFRFCDIRRFLSLFAAFDSTSSQASLYGQLSAPGWARVISQVLLQAICLFCFPFIYMVKMAGYCPSFFLRVYEPRRTGVHKHAKENNNLVNIQPS